MADASAKKFQGLLNGIVRHSYYHDPEVTDEFLKTELYSDMPQDEFEKLTLKCRGIIKSMAITNMDLNQTETFLTSQTKKREGAISEIQAKVLLKFWKSHRTKIHESLVERSCWNNRLHNLSWRIDVKSQARHGDKSSAPTAIIELQLQNRQDDNNKETEVIRFEMDDTSMSKMLKSLKEIESHFEEYKT